MSSDEPELHEESQDAEGGDFGNESAELSLDQLSQAYAEVMREQGLGDDLPETLGDDIDGENDALEDEQADESESAEIELADGESATVSNRKQKSLDEIDADDNAGCPISPKSIVESILFVGAPAGTKLTARILASAMRDVSPKEIKKIIKQLNSEYEQQDSPFRIVLEDKNYKMKLTEDMVEVQNHFFGRNRPAKLNQSAIDVLAIVAYNQPVSRSQVDKIRARSSGGVLNQLVKRDLLVTESTEKPKEVVFRTTDRFLQLFGLGELDDLPQTSVVSDLEELSDF